MISVNGISANLEFLILADNVSPAVISFYDRSQSVVKSIGAALNIKNPVVKASGTDIYINSGFDVMIAPIITGKDKFYHAVAISKLFNKSIMMAAEGEEEESLYNLLMARFNLPLMKEWSRELFLYSLNNGYIRKNERYILGKKHSKELATGLDKSGLKDIKTYKILINNDEELANIIKKLFQLGKICISKVPQKKLRFTSMDSYFEEYGKSLVENLERQIKPLTELNGNIDDFVFKHMRLFPQQAAQVNGVLELLRHSSYAIINEGMGCGKTPQGAGICEGYFVRKFLRENPGKPLRDAYIREGIINYRNIVMCPGHLVDKWAQHIKSEVPYARVTILNDFSQLLDIKKRGIKRQGREFFVISKDFAKLSYQSKPIPRKRRYGPIMMKVCKDCDKEIFTTDTKCPDCSSTNIKLIKSGIYGTGMVCPMCNNILLPYKKAKLNLFDDNYTTPLDHVDFAYQCDSNSKCYYCGTELWEPHMASLGETYRSNAWYRATHYANKAHKGKKTVWVHKKYAEDYFALIGETPLNEIDSDINRGTRKIAPGVYIKKQLKGYFDFAIFDEAHLYKSGTSAQANCMSAIIGASKKHLALTGTIAGGMASHLFYLLYRIDPRRMKQAGYEWTDEAKFVEKYGVIEKRFECSDTSNHQYNTSSRGRQVGSPSYKPGISPLIFMDFLLDKTVFLDLTDMSRYLPPLKEIVELVDIPRCIEDEQGNLVENPVSIMKRNYDRVIDVLKRMTKEKNGGRGILSTMLQFSLSYLDKPYGVSPIKSPKTGEVIVEPESFYEFSDVNVLLPKEKRLIEIVKKELEENRNCVIYAEYTGSPETCVSYRLKELIEKYCGLKGHVDIIESAYPVASKREEWMHKRAEDGIKVFITNPRNVETGLDFCFTKNGKLYNYPTLIYYQMGYSLFTIWQSSRRHYRLNNKEECRTYYLALRGTIQQAVIALIAEKMAATSAIQGKFSTEGLTAMANGVDAKMKLAQALSNMDDSTGSNLQGMFDVINQDVFDDSKYTNYRPMMILSELLGADVPTEKTVEELSDEDITSIFDIFDNFLGDFTSRHDDVVFGIFEEVTDDDTPNLPKVSNRKKAAASNGQILLF